MILLTLIHQRSLAAAMYRKLPVFAASDGAHPILSDNPEPLPHPPPLAPYPSLGALNDGAPARPWFMPAWASERTLGFLKLKNKRMENRVKGEKGRELSHDLLHATQQCSSCFVFSFLSSFPQWRVKA